MDDGFGVVDEFDVFIEGRSVGCSGWYWIDVVLEIISKYDLIWRVFGHGVGSGIIRVLDSTNIIIPVIISINEIDSCIDGYQ